MERDYFADIIRPRGSYRKSYRSYQFVSWVDDLDGP